MSALPNLNKRGLSIIELIIASALILTALGLGFMFFFFGNNSFGIGTRQYNVQSNIRTAADVLAEDIRYASYIEIFPDNSSVPAVIDAFENYVYLDSPANEIVFASQSDTRRYRIGESDSSIHFTSSDSNKILTFLLSGNDNQQNYFIEQEIASLNLDVGSTQVIEGVNNGEVLFYQTLDDYLAATLEPELVDYSTDADTLTLTFNRSMSTYEIFPSDAPVSAAIDGSRIIITAGSLDNNTTYLFSCEVLFPGEYLISFECGVKRTGSNYYWTIEKN